jgi:putative heme-binding domain-containing protein
MMRYLRAFDFLNGDAKDAALLQLAAAKLPESERGTLVGREVLSRIKTLDISKPRFRKTLDGVLDAQRGTREFVTLIDKFNDKGRYPQVLQLAQQNSEGQLGVEAIRMLLAKGQQTLIRQGLTDTKIGVAESTARVLGHAGDRRASALLRPLLDDATRSDDLRRASVRGAVQAPEVARMLLERAQSGELDPKLKDAVAAALHASNVKSIQQSARKLFPLPPTKNNQPLPPIGQLVKRRGDVGKGRLVFQTVGTCAKCHVVNKLGKQVGPDLSGIGSKLSRQAFFESVIFPSAGISHNYENHVVLLADGTTVNGIIVSQAKGKVSLKGADAIVRTYNTSDIDEMVKQNISLMPGDLHKLLSVDDLVNVVEYMATLRAPQP